MDTFDKAAKEWRDDLIALLRDLQAHIDDDYRASENPSDDTPGMCVTISTNDDCADWGYQTGDNSYTGGCYGDPYWGVGAIYRDSDPAEVADELLDDLGESWYHHGS